jgi:protein TonB
MGTTGISPGNFNDLVFEDRFRQYGAYALRKTYNDRLFKACIAGIGTAVLAVATPFVMQLFGDPAPLPDIDHSTYIQDTMVIDITPNTNVDPPKVDPPEGAKPLKGNDLNFKVSEEQDTATDESAIVQENFKQGRKDGDTTNTGIIVIDKPGKGIDTTGTALPPTDFPTDWPKFNGNLAQWLSSHLEYPGYAKDIGISGTVYVSFIVDEEGNVGEAKIIRDIGGGCGDKALQAVKQMPQWTPGRLNGKPAKVRYNLPVKFSFKN